MSTEQTVTAALRVVKLGCYQLRLGVQEATPTVQRLSSLEYAPSTKITPLETLTPSERTESTATDQHYSTICRQRSEVQEEEELQGAEPLAAVGMDVLRRRHEQRIHDVQESVEMVQPPS
jgi:hypothetical protein